MRKNKSFAEALLLCTYFNPQGQETLPDVHKRYKEPFPLVSLYAHCSRHMKANLHRWLSINGLSEKSAAMKKAERAKELVEQTMSVVELPKLSNSEHENALDEFIAKGREKLKYNNLPITSTTYIQAIKAKAEIEKSNKDRRFDAMKTLFAGMGSKNDTKTV